MASVYVYNPNDNTYCAKVRADSTFVPPAPWILMPEAELPAGAAPGPGPDDGSARALINYRKRTKAFLRSPEGVVLRAALKCLVNDRANQIRAGHNGLLTWLNSQPSGVGLTNKGQLAGLAIADRTVSDLLDAIDIILDNWTLDD